MKKLLILSSLVVNIIFKSTIIFGQSVGFMEFSPDPRSLSMGGVQSALDANSYAFFNNGSSIALTESKFSASALYNSWMPNTLDNKILGVAGFLKLGDKSALSFGYRTVGYPSYDLVDNNGNITETFTPDESSLGVGFSYALRTDLAASANVQFISSDLGGPEVGKAFAVNLDFQYVKSENLKFGLKLANLGTKLDYGYKAYSLPAYITLGTDYTFKINEKSEFNALADVGFFISPVNFTAALGAEYIYSDWVFVRLGTHLGNKEKGIPTYFSSGAGILFRNINIDFAYLISGSDSPVANSFSLSLGYSF